MRVMVVGATGIIGSAVVDALGGHEVIRVGSSSGDVRADISRPESIRELFAGVGQVDAVVSCAGSARFNPLAELSDDDFAFSMANKLMGQVNLVRLGMEHVRDGGSITLTSGILSQVPMPGSAAISMVNAGVEAFARAAALEAPRGIRVNTVSPPWVSETLVQMGRDPSGGLPAATVAKAYLSSIQDEVNGTVIDARRFA
ncbi:MAG TPA: short chain dehydrogenase [Longimicrobium sp.]